MVKRELVDPMTGEDLRSLEVDRIVQMKAEQRSRTTDAYGREILSSVPVAPPIGYKRQPTMVEHLRRMVRSELLAREAASQGMETFEEAEDFDVGDAEDLDPQSPYEDQFDPPILEAPAEAQPSPGVEPAAPAVPDTAEPEPRPAAPAKAPKSKKESSSGED